MFRAIITPNQTSLTIELPQELVGKPVEVLAVEIDKLGSALPKTKPTPEEIASFYDQFQVDMTGFKFNRDEANER